MERRYFIKNTLASASFVGAGGLSLGSCSGEQKKHITILHTNDVHSHIDPFPSGHSRFPGLGGLARRAGLVNQIRKENPSTLLFDAGDIFQGTPYFNFYGGELEMKLMTLLNYDAGTIGNHEFDNGLDGLLAQLPYGKFDFVCSNYDFSNTIIDGFTKPYQTYIRDGIKIGVYGLGIELAGLVNKEMFKETLYLDPYDIASDLERQLKEEEKCDLVICLSHLGYQYENDQRPDDMTLATKTKHTDLIIGGHTHTFLDKPSVVTNAVERDILVNQVGCFGVRLGRIDFYFDADRMVADGVSIRV
ncbi:metallophosphatase [Maribacter chungangensis]|uniref:Metallophosphatase n=1 Tax=Maribacter chungangensis TaxID=1069117 RepID=A0ABW3B509_9FLAO